MIEATDIDRALLNGYSFAILKLPNEDSIRVFTPHKHPGSATSEFFFAPYGQPVGEATTYYRVTSIDGDKESIPYGANTFDPYCINQEEYIKALTAIISRLKTTGGKTVYSRIAKISSSFGLPEGLGRRLLRYVKSGGSCFSYCLYTAQYGLWIGRSPEILIKANHIDKSFETVALAGSRRPADNMDWDAKNIREHRFVTDHITTRLRDNGIPFKTGQTETLRLPNIEHIRTRISGLYRDYTPRQVVDMYHPTAAICGFPADAAQNDINRFEPHERRLYGGSIGYSDTCGTIVYLNIRCAHITPTQVFAYAGGGITSQSDPYGEWGETQLKVNAILENLKNE